MDIYRIDPPAEDPWDLSPEELEERGAFWRTYRTDLTAAEAGLCEWCESWPVEPADCGMCARCTAAREAQWTPEGDLR